jgi:general secretion pathway protein H
MTATSTREGFSLLEILVVLAVIAVLAAVVPPLMTGALTRMRAEGAAGDVQVALADARAQALREGRQIRVVFDERSRSWQATGGPWRKAPDGVTVSAPERDADGVPAIVFYPDGTSSGGQVVVASANQAWSMVVEVLTGQVRRLHASAR